MSRSLLLFALFCSTLFAQSQPYYANPTIRNAASRTPAMAQGSFISVSVDPTPGDFPADAAVSLTTADGAGVRLTPLDPPSFNDGLAHAERWFIIPSNARLGSALITLEAGGGAYSNFIQIVETAPGIFAKSYYGYGPALALNHPSTPNALTTAAVPGGIVSLFATGLNGATTADVSVELAGQPIAPLYAGPQGQPALDQINFVVPQDTIIGCYVPVAIRVRGILSNQTTLSINKDPYACAHPLGLSYSDLKTLDAGGSVQLAQFNVSNDIYSEQAPRETASLFFSSWNAAGASVLSGVQTTDKQLFACYSSNPLTGGVFQRSTIGDAGTVIVSGPNQKQLQLQSNPGVYSATVAENLPYFIGGPWQLSTTGGAAYGAFQQNFTLPPPLKFANLDNSTVIPSQGYTLRWDASGFSANDILGITLTIDPTYANYATCTAPAVAGQLLLPNSILDPFKGKSTIVLANIRSKTGERPQFSVSTPNGSPIRGFIDYSFIQRFTSLVQ